jgi:uncharacterized protein YegP (UPF0339 family)
MSFDIYRDEGGKWRWQFLAASGGAVATSAETFASKTKAKLAVADFREHVMRKSNRVLGAAYVLQMDSGPRAIDPRVRKMSDAVDLLAGERVPADAPIRAHLCALFQSNGKPVVVLRRTKLERKLRDIARELREFINLMDDGDLGKKTGIDELNDLTGGDILGKAQGREGIPDWMKDWIDPVTHRPTWDGPEGPGGQSVIQGGGRGKTDWKDKAKDRLNERPNAHDLLKDMLGIDTGDEGGDGAFDAGGNTPHDEQWSRAGWSADVLAYQDGQYIDPYQPAADGQENAFFYKVEGAVLSIGLGIATDSVPAVVGGICALATALSDPPKRMPDPEGDGEKSRAPKLPVRLAGEAVTGKPIRNDRRRVRIDGEWGAGTSYGWIRFGAPRARGTFLPGVSSMPSDDSDERPSIWIGASTHAADSGTSSDDAWIVLRGHWGWTRFGAPHALQAG